MKKRILGQFFTTNDIWLTEHIIKFIKEKIKEEKIDTLYDPFAGGGDLLKIGKKIGIKKTIGLDIDKSLQWEINDSLTNIPQKEHSLIITNPPYLGKSSAKRRGFFYDVEKYFNEDKEDDLYKIALKKILLLNTSGIIIIPETFINSKLLQNKEIKEKIYSITILENNPFSDTDLPICIVCFNKNENKSGIKIYKNEKFIGLLNNLEKLKLKPNNTINIKFNDINGKIALIAYDGTSKGKEIKFLPIHELKYDIKNIKHSSRAISVINILDNKFSDEEYSIIIKNANQILENFRQETKDILLSPFKGNTKEGKRRRRLDFKLARAILEKSILLYKNKKNG